MCRNQQVINGVNKDSSGQSAMKGLHKAVLVSELYSCFYLADFYPPQDGVRFLHQAFLPAQRKQSCPANSTPE